MAAITDITPQKKGNLFNIFIDGEFSFSADIDFIAENQLLVGTKFTEDAKNQLISAANDRRTLRYAYHLLDYRDYTHKELVRKLIEKGCEEESSEKAVEKLEELGYINDTRRAESIIERYSSKYGRDGILYELRKRGIKKDDAEALLDEKLSEEDEFAAARREVERKLRGKDANDRKIVNNLFNSLRAKGFSFETIKSAYNDYMGHL